MTGDEVLGDEILKVDAWGRVRTSPERREALLDEFERCGITGKRFAEMHGIKYQTFASWRKKRKKRAGGKGSGGRKKEPVAAPIGLALTEVVRAGSEGASLGVDEPLRVELPGGAQLSVSNVQGVHLAAKLIRALGH